MFGSSNLLDPPVTRNTVTLDIPTLREDPCLASQGDGGEPHIYIYSLLKLHCYCVTDCSKALAILASSSNNISNVDSDLRYKITDHGYCFASSIRSAGKIRKGEDPSVSFQTFCNGILYQIFGFSNPIGISPSSPP